MNRKVLLLKQIEMYGFCSQPTPPRTNHDSNAFPGGGGGGLGGRSGQRVEEQGTWGSHTRKHSETGHGSPVDRGA